MDRIIQKIDELSINFKFLEAYNLTQEYKFAFQDVEWYIRILKAAFIWDKIQPKRLPRRELKAIYEDALQYCEAGLRIKPNSPSLLAWKGICIDAIAKSSGINKRIEKAFETREYWDKALKIDPNYKTALTCMGIWCFKVADLSDIKRGFASTFFTSPPTSTYEEAITYLSKGYDENPHVSVLLLLTIAKCNQKLGNLTRCKEFCEKVIQFPDIGYEVTEAKNEAHQLLKHL